MTAKRPTIVWAIRTLDDEEIVAWRDRIFAALTAARQAAPDRPAVPHLIAIAETTAEMFAELLDRGERDDVDDLDVHWERHIPSTLQAAADLHERYMAEQRSAASAPGSAGER